MTLRILARDRIKSQDPTLWMCGCSCWTVAIIEKPSNFTGNDGLSAYYVGCFIIRVVL